MPELKHSFEVNHFGSHFKDLHEKSGTAHKILLEKEGMSHSIENIVRFYAEKRPKMFDYYVRQLADKNEVQALANLIVFFRGGNEEHKKISLEIFKIVARHNRQVAEELVELVKHTTSEGHAPEREEPEKQPRGSKKPSEEPAGKTGEKPEPRPRVVRELDFDSETGDLKYKPKEEPGDREELPKGSKDEERRKREEGVRRPIPAGLNKELIEASKEAFYGIALLERYMSEEEKVEHDFKEYEDIVRGYGERGDITSIKKFGKGLKLRLDRVEKELFSQLESLAEENLSKKEVKKYLKDLKTILKQQNQSKRLHLIQLEMYKLKKREEQPTRAPRPEEKEPKPKEEPKPEKPKRPEKVGPKEAEPEPKEEERGKKAEEQKGEPKPASKEEANKGIVVVLQASLEFLEENNLIKKKELQKLSNRLDNVRSAKELKVIQEEINDKLSNIKYGDIADLEDYLQTNYGPKANDMQSKIMDKVNFIKAGDVRKERSLLGKTMELHKVVGLLHTNLAGLKQRRVERIFEYLDLVENNYSARGTNVGGKKYKFRDLRKKLSRGKWLAFSNGEIRELYLDSKGYLQEKLDSRVEDVSYQLGRYEKAGATVEDLMAAASKLEEAKKLPISQEKINLLAELEQEFRVRVNDVLTVTEKKERVNSLLDLVDDAMAFLKQHPEVELTRPRMILTKQAILKNLELGVENYADIEKSYKTIVSEITEDILKHVEEQGGEKKLFEILNINPNASAQDLLPVLMDYYNKNKEQFVLSKGTRVDTEKGLPLPPFHPAPPRPSMVGVDPALALERNRTLKTLEAREDRGSIQGQDQAEKPVPTMRELDDRLRELANLGLDKEVITQLDQKWGKARVGTDADRVSLAKDIADARALLLSDKDTSTLGPESGLVAPVEPEEHTESDKNSEPEEEPIEKPTEVEEIDTPEPATLRGKIASGLRSLGRRFRREKPVMAEPESAVKASEDAGKKPENKEEEDIDWFPEDDEERAEATPGTEKGLGLPPLPSERTQELPPMSDEEVDRELGIGQEEEELKPKEPTEEPISPEATDRTERIQEQDKAAEEREQQTLERIQKLEKELRSKLAEDIQTDRHPQVAEAERIRAKANADARSAEAALIEAEQKLFLIQNEHDYAEINLDLIKSYLKSSDLSETESALERAKSKLKTTEENLTRQEEEVRLAKEKYKVATENYNSSLDERTKQARLLITAEQNLNATENELSAVQKKVNGYKDELEDLRTPQNGQPEPSSDKIRVLESVIIEMDKKEHVLEEKANAARKARDTISERHSIVSTEEDKAHSSMVAIEEELQLAEQVRASTNVDLQSVRREVTSLIDLLSGLKSKTNSELKKAEKKLSAVKRQLDTQTKEVASAQKKKDLADNRSAEANDKKLSLQDELEKTEGEKITKRIAGTTETTFKLEELNKALDFLDSQVTGTFFEKRAARKELKELRTSLTKAGKEGNLHEVSLLRLMIDRNLDKQIDSYQRELKSYLDKTSGDSERNDRIYEKIISNIDNLRDGKATELEKVQELMRVVNILKERAPNTRKGIVLRLEQMMALDKKYSFADRYTVGKRRYSPDELLTELKKEKGSKISDKELNLLYRDFTVDFEALTRKKAYYCRDLLRYLETNPEITLDVERNNALKKFIQRDLRLSNRLETSRNIHLLYDPLEKLAKEIDVFNENQANKEKE